MLCVRGCERGAGVGADGEECRVPEVEQAGESDDHVEAEREQHVDRERSRCPAQEIRRLVEHQREEERRTEAPRPRTRVSAVPMTHGRAPYASAASAKPYMVSHTAESVTVPGLRAPEERFLLDDADEQPDDGGQRETSECRDQA